MDREGRSRNTGMRHDQTQAAVSPHNPLTIVYRELGFFPAILYYSLGILGM